MLLAHWPLIVCDLHEQYGVDVAAGVLLTVPAEWLRTRIVGLLSTDSRLARAVAPPKTET
jgi:hypothetical protein